MAKSRHPNMSRKDRHSVVLSSDYTRVLLAELKAAVNDGAPLFVRYGGYGMEPLLHNGKEKVNVRPVKSGFQPKLYDVLAIEMYGKCLFRRFLRGNADGFVVMGDGCRYEETVSPTNVLGVVDEVRREDGTCIMCNGDKWTKQSAKAVKKRQWINRIKNLFSGKRIRYWAIAYFAMLLLSMWMPLGKIPMPDNLILGLRPDHLFHASIYCFCAFFLAKLCCSHTSRGIIANISIWAGSIAISLITEFGQKLLPYRSFDINDLIANAIGVTLGWIVLLIVAHSHTQSSNRGK